MKPVFFTVGPSQLYPTVPEHIQTALNENILSLSHRSDAFKKINRQTQSNLRKLMNIPNSHHIFYTSCALEAMERVIQNTVQKHVVHFVNGSFSREFFQTSVDLKKQTIRVDAEDGHGFDFEKIRIPKKPEVICLVHNETSTGVALPMEHVYQLKRNYPDKLIAIDIVSSAPYVSVDFAKIDIAFFSVQKGFGLPAGLGVLIVNDTALEKADWLASRNISIGSYHNFLKFHEFESTYQTRETPNVLAIYLLGNVAGDMLQSGIGNLRREIDEKAEMVYSVFDNHKKYAPFVNEPYRSKTTMVIDVEGESSAIIKKLEEHGYIVAKGYGKHKDTHIRIGNFPTHTAADVTSLLKQFT